MTKIANVHCQLVDLEPEQVRSDASQSFVKQETVLVTIETADGLAGTGYSYTIGTGGSAVVAMLRDHVVAGLLGADARNVEQIWQRMRAGTRATTVGAITSLAMAAVDVALWDLRGKRANEPVWRLAGGAHDRLPLYDTEGGWIHLSCEDLVRNAIVAKGAGLRGVKVKVGKPSIVEDAERLAAVRDAVGPAFEIMVDANQCFTGAEATRRAHAFESLGIAWFEEPLPADDVAGHVRLARSTSVPIAVGESLYSSERFAEYLSTGGAGIVQVDAARVGGITPWLKVAHAAESFNVPVAPHFLMELHASLACAVPNGMYVERIPQLGSIIRKSLVIENGWVRPPESPGIGIDWNPDAIDDLRVA
jgi:L-alanine-DL-glutamate epimerase-like enolase superfamily enzyme